MAVTKPSTHSREDVLDALRRLDDEGFNYLVVQLWQQASSAGGFKDKTGWHRLQDVTKTFMDAMG